jgi:hypothetical protein
VAAFHSPLCQAEDTSLVHQAPPDKRIFGVLPNYRTADASRPFQPLSVKQKFYIGYKDSTDYPIYFLSGMFAGIAQAEGTNRSYGGGARGFGLRLGAAYADQGVANLMTESLFPALLREDPRYFRRGTGSIGSRTRYALTRIFVTRTDSGSARFNFSEVLGNSASVAVSTLYSPDTRAMSAGLQKLGIQLATDAAGGVLKEFWPDVKRRFFTRHVSTSP